MDGLGVGVPLARVRAGRQADRLAWTDGTNPRHRPLLKHTPKHAQFFRPGDKEVNRSPLAKKLLKIPGVVGVFLGRNFITITKTPDIIWQVRPCLGSGCVFVCVFVSVVASSPDWAPMTGRLADRD